MFLEKDSSIELGSNEIELQITCEIQEPEPDVGVFGTHVSDLCIYSGGVELTKLFSEDQLAQFECEMLEHYRDSVEGDE